MYLGLEEQSRTNISFFVDTSSYDEQPQTITLNKGLVANTTSFGGVSNYRFSLMNDITVPVVNNVANFNNIDVYEGTYVTTQTFHMTTTIHNKDIF